MNTEQNRKHVDMTVYCCCVRYRVSPALDYQPTYNADFMHWYHNMMGSVLSNPIMRCDMCNAREWYSVLWNKESRFNCQV